MPPRATPGDAGTYASIGTGGGTSPLNVYLRANSSHKFYAAIWGKVSRAGQVFDVGAHMHSRSDGSTQIFGFYNRAAAGATQYPQGATQLGNSGSGVAPTGTGIDFFQDQATQPASTSSAAIDVLLAGNQGGVSAPNYGKTAGFILYGFYVEDLTVSGRDYAAVSALVKAKQLRDKAASGRDYGNDTYSTAN